MKVLFLKAGDSNLSVNRIYIDNLSGWLKTYCDHVDVSRNVVAGYDIYICSKYSRRQDLEKIKQTSPNSRIGIIHPSDINRAVRRKLSLADFFLVGSIEEKDYYSSYCSQIFRFPQIENINIERKRHCQVDPIVIGYHGNLEHLEESRGALKRALERLNEVCPLRLVVVYNKRLGSWSKGRPNIPIQIVDWSYENMIHEMSSVDIGIVPCINNSFLDKNILDIGKIGAAIKISSGRLNDYSLRFKNNANNGRALVFHQCGVPVVADFWPCHFELLSNEDYGYLAHSEESWYQSLLKLSKSHELRQAVSDNAYQAATTIYDPEKWTRKFYKFLQNV